MGRMHSKGKGISKSALPYRRTPPSWLKTSPTEVVEHVCKLAKKGLTPSQIGVILRDSYGIAQVSHLTGSKILRMLKKNGARSCRATPGSISSGRPRAMSVRSGTMPRSDVGSEERAGRRQQRLPHRGSATVYIDGGGCGCGYCSGGGSGGGGGGGGCGCRAVERSRAWRYAHPASPHASLSARAGLAPALPEDLYCLIKKAVQVRKHLDKFRQDKDAKFRLILIESRIHRTSRYYRTVKALPPNWKYESATASTLVS
mgnify:CR=1 FL=1